MSKVDQVIAAATAELGEPYVWGDEGPNTFDCSGLMLWSFNHVGIKLPRTAAQQQDATKLVTGKPMPGDLVFYGDPATHVALYLGGGKMIHAPRRGDVVRIANVYGSPTYRRVGGLGAAAAAVLDPIANVAGDATASVQDWLGGVRYGVVELAIAGAGLALIGFGLWRTVRPITKGLMP